MKIYTLLFAMLLSAWNLSGQEAKKRIWFDTDIMIGLPERAPREVDDGVTLIMALNDPSIEIIGISLITELEYAKSVTNKILDYHAPERNIPIYAGSEACNDLGVETPASLALAEALKKEKFAILALGPATNVATVIKNHPELTGQIEEIVFCAGRTTGYPFRPGLRQATVGDYNFEKDVESFRVILDAGVKVVLSGFQCSESILISRMDTEFLSRGSEADKWLHQVLIPWQERASGIFGVPGFIPYDATPLGYITHPQYFLIHKDIPAVINYRENDATIGRNRPEMKHFLEVGNEYVSKWKVDFAYQTLPGFEEVVIENMREK